MAPDLRSAFYEHLAEEGLDLAFNDVWPTAVPNLFKPDGTVDVRGAKRFIRYLEGFRGGYPTWRAVGAEPRNAFLTRLATVRGGGGAYLAERLPRLQGVINRQMEQLQRVAQQEGYSSPFPFLVGVSPEAPFNARVHPVADGALVLVNVGVMDLLFSILKINLANSGDAADPARLQDSQATMALADSFNAYLYGGVARPLPPLDRKREEFLWTVLHSAEAFVVAHEIGHIVQGHVTLPETANSRAKVKLTPSTEIEADALALDIVPLASGFDLDDPRMTQLLAGGMIAVVVIAAAVEAASRSLKIRTPSAQTHPALKRRLDNLSREFEMRFPNARASERGETFAGWLLLFHLPEVLKWLALVDRAVRR